MAKMCARRSVAIAVVLGILGLVIGGLALMTPAPEVAAEPGVDGFYAFNANWRHGPYASSDPSHTAYSYDSNTRLSTSGFTINGIMSPDQRIGSEDELANVTGGSLSVSLVGINGARAFQATGSGGDIRVTCETPDIHDDFQDYCSIPSRAYSITLSWTATGYEAECYYAWAFWDFTPPQPTLDNCPRKTVSDTVTRSVVAGRPNEPTTTTAPPGDPTAGFTSTASAADRYEFSFESTSTDPQDPPEDLTYAWDFGDTATSTDRNPVHRYEHAGTYDVTLRVTDTSGASASHTAQVVIEAGTIVNSTGDGTATDPATKGCDTGQQVDSEPECTLRAAIEVANLKGGGEITFDIEGGGIPSIAAASPLPTITQPTTVDGTSQAGGWVEVAGSGDHVLQVQGGSSVISGLVVRGGDLQIDVAGGTGQVIRGNRIGTNAAGTAGDAASSQGIFVQGGDGARIEDNVIGTADIGIGLRSGSGTTVESNSVGVTEGGTASIGDTDAAIIVTAPGATVADNVVRGTSVGIELLRSTATSAKVTGNTVGVRRDGTAALAGQAYGIRTDGAPGATITGNRVAATNGIVLSGSDQTTTDAEGVHLEEPGTEPIDGAATGTSAIVSDNDIGMLANGTAAADMAYGIVTWAGMAETTIDGNRIGTTRSTAVRLLGGSSHDLTRNTIGGDPDAGSPTPVHDGIEVDGGTDVTIGGVGDAANTIVHTDGGIDARTASTGLRIEANRIAAPNPESEGGGIEVGEDSASAVITANRVVGGSTGISADAAEAKITGNQLLAQSDVGIEAEADDVTISGSVVVAGSDGIRVDGEGITVTQNRIGLEAGTDEVTGNGGVGLTIEDGKVTATKNIIAGTGSEGIKVEAGTATLRSNRVWETGGDAIDVAGGPEVPNLAAAARSGSGVDTRTTLLLNGLPDDDAGTIEVFANSNCGSSEAQFLMDINRKKSKTETARIIQIKGASTRDHFTVTYTDEDGRTSELSSCVTAAQYADGDGDGSIDPFDEVFGAADNPGVGVYATDNEKLMLALVSPFNPETGTGGGEIEQLRFIADPAPGGHPAGWSTPYGVMSFRITNVEPGAHTALALAIVDPTDPFPAGTAYWKYGSKTPGAEPTWWNFAYDAASDTGVVVTDAADMPYIGITRVLGIKLVDGGRGDSDGGANRTITDPGAPVLGAPEQEPETPTTTVTAEPATTTTASGAGTMTSTTAAPGGSDATATGSGSLPRTGSDQSGIVTAGLCAIAVGLVLVFGARRRSARA